MPAIHAPRIALLILALLTTPALAHEFWIRPETFGPAPGQPFRVTLMHGERFDGDPVPRVDSSIDRFEILAPGDGPRPVRGLSGSTISYGRAPAGSTIVYQSRWIESHLPAKAFNAYLEEEGLHEITTLRDRAGETLDPGRERYMRCAKALLAPLNTEDRASTPHAIADRPVGLPLEIVLQPATEPAVITAVVLVNGKPLAGQPVVAVSEASPESLHHAKTDEHGRVSFNTPIDMHSDGPWMLTTLHMSRVDPATSTDAPAADWQSLWASLTFELRR